MILFSKSLTPEVSHLINSWLNIICQITTKYATIRKLKLFHQLNTPGVWTRKSSSTRARQRASERSIFWPRGSRPRRGSHYIFHSLSSGSPELAQRHLDGALTVHSVTTWGAQLCAYLRPPTWQCTYQFVFSFSFSFFALSIMASVIIFLGFSLPSIMFSLEYNYFMEIVY